MPANNNRFIFAPYLFAVLLHAFCCVSSESLIINDKQLYTNRRCMLHTKVIAGDSPHCSATNHLKLPCPQAISK